MLYKCHTWLVFWQQHVWNKNISIPLSSIGNDQPFLTDNSLNFLLFDKHFFHFETQLNGFLRGFFKITHTHVRHLHILLLVIVFLFVSFSYFCQAHTLCILTHIVAKMVCLPHFITHLVRGLDRKLPHKVHGCKKIMTNGVHCRTDISIPIPG